MSEFKIEAGKHYVNRLGEVRGPMFPAGAGDFSFCTHDENDEPDWFFFENGRCYKSGQDSQDLVAEFTPEPVVDLEPLASAVEELTEAVEAAPVAGRKDDAGKPRFDLIAPEFLEEVGKVLHLGAEKYAPRNWEHGMNWSRPFAAMMRHMWAWWRGEENDPETGLSHLAHASCNAMFLLAYSRRGTGTDDRWAPAKK